MFRLVRYVTSEVSSNNYMPKGENKNIIHES